MNNRDIKKFANMFKLRKHQRKVERYKEEYLEEFYWKQRILKQDNIEEMTANVAA